MRDMFFFVCLLASVLAEQALLADNTVTNFPASLRFSEEWHSLGPFQMGTREAVWGADPLEAFGGFHKLQVTDNATFPSSLTPNATVSWRTFNGSVSTSSTATSVQWNISYPDIDWLFVQQIYGWTALQYQTWIRGTIYNNSPHLERVNIHVPELLEFNVNGNHFFGGDFYGFDRAPLMIDLLPGRNVIEARLIRDVRAMGGASPPTISAKIHLERCEPDVHVVKGSLIAPELVNGYLTSAYMSIVVQNANDYPIVFRQCVSGSDSSNVRLLNNGLVILAPGQSRPIGLQLPEEATCSKVMFVRLCYDMEDRANSSHARNLDFIAILKERQATEAWKFTFLHASGIVSYAVLKPPQQIGSTTTVHPLLLALHGAGVDADDDFVRHSFDGVTDLESFVLMPAGGSLWSGDDWHTWGLSEVLAAVHAVDSCIKNVHWNGSRASTRNFLLAGHSNGGQGTWYIASHQPDRTIAAAPVSGYTSVENYVPFTMWSITQQNSILNLARDNFRNELLMPNLEQTPIFQLHGENDDNVPAYHSRLMSSLRATLGFEHQYVELAGRGHWFEGIMSTQPLQRFYKQHLASPRFFPLIPTEFRFIIPNSDDMGSRFGLVVDQLRTPDRLGQIIVNVDTKKAIWHLRTHNIHRFHFDSTTSLPYLPKKITIDRQRQETTIGNQSFVLSPLGKWVSQHSNWKSLSQRSGRQRGALDAMLRTNGAFQILSCATCDHRLSLQASHNMLQYFGADSNILIHEDYDNALSGSSNIITFALGHKVPSSLLYNFPVSFQSDGIVLVTPELPRRLIPYSSGLGAIMLRPLPDERLELLVWGWDKAALEYAARLIPTLTGAGQPDFVVIGPDARWLGAGGAKALGFFDRDWQISRGSYV